MVTIADIRRDRNRRRQTCGVAGKIVVLATLALFIAPVLAGELECGPLVNAFGPFDYRDPRNFVATVEHPMGRAKRVENVHFQAGMKGLDLKRYTVDALAAEFGYTLRAFPNHPEALHAVSKLEKRAGGRLPQNTASAITPMISADCFFDRAMRFAPDDGRVRFVYGIHLHDRGRLEEARASYVEAERLGMDSRELYYNVGLLLCDLKQWEAAREYAKKAYAAGHPLDGLRRRLTAAGFPP